jgi:phasin
MILHCTIIRIGEAGDPLGPTPMPKLRKEAAMVAKPPYDVPPEMREFAEKSVDQARKAFDGFMGAAQKAVETVSGSTESARANAEQSAQKAMAYAEQNVAAAFDLAQKLVRAKDPAEVLQHQSEFVKAQMASFQRQMNELGAAVQKAASNVTKTK